MIFFRFKIFSVCHRYQRHRWCTLNCEYLREFSKKFEMALMVFSGAWGKLIHEKKQKLKIWWHCPFKIYLLADSAAFHCNKQQIFMFKCFITTYLSIFLLSYTHHELLQIRTVPVESPNTARMASSLPLSHNISSLRVACTDFVLFL